MIYINLHFWMTPIYIYISLFTYVYIYMHVHYLDQSDYLHGSCQSPCFRFNFHTRKLQVSLELDDLKPRLLGTLGCECMAS